LICGGPFVWTCLYKKTDDNKKTNVIFSIGAVFLYRKTMKFRKTYSEVEIAELLRQGRCSCPSFLSVETVNPTRTAAQKLGSVIGEPRYISSPMQATLEPKAMSEAICKSGAVSSPNHYRCLVLTCPTRSGRTPGARGERHRSVGMGSWWCERTLVYRTGARIVQVRGRSRTCSAEIVRSRHERSSSFPE